MPAIRKSDRKRSPRTKVEGLAGNKKSLTGKQMKKVKGGVSDETLNTDAGAYAKSATGGGQKSLGSLLATVGTILVKSIAN
ncbi:MAG TPA: hypothetical protein VFC63_07910 [Blastocatellia bacterium]|nr:hypothetical protein [Blastocatellia bacterium]